MKYIIFYLLILFCQMTLSSCSQEKVELDNSYENTFKLTNVVNGSPETYRLRLNSLFSVVVNLKYDDKDLIDVNYEIVPQVTDDQFGVINLAKGQEGYVKLDIFKSEISSSEDVLDSYISHSLPGDNVDYGCDCKSEVKDRINDCQLRKFYSTVYCDGTLCTACSLLISFSNVDGQMLTSNQSMVILPINLN